MLPDASQAATAAGAELLAREAERLRRVVAIPSVKNHFRAPHGRERHLDWAIRSVLPLAALFVSRRPQGPRGSRAER